MSVTINVYEYFEVTFDDGETKEGGSRTVANTITADGQVYEVKFNISATGAQQILWEDGDGGIADFDFLWFETDKDCLLELAWGGGGGLAVFAVNASTPFIIGRDDIDETALAGSGLIASVCDKITVEAITASTNTRLVLIT